MSKVQELIAIAMNTEDSSDSRWSMTGEIIADDKGDFLDFDKKAQAKAFTKLLDGGADLDDIPLEGMSRTGENIILRKADGKIKWSSWVATSRMMQNTSDIWKGLDAFGWDVVFPKGVLISRYALRKLLKDLADSKDGETAAETVIRCLELIGKKIPELLASDEDAVGQRFIETYGAFTEWRSA